MKERKVLVLMATYNGEKFVEKQIETILNQKEIDDVEILVSDDCSSDNTLNIVRKFSNKNKVNILDNKNKKFGSAAPNFFNLIKHSNIENFDYIAFSDQDDIWFGDKLISAIKKLKKYHYDGFSSDVVAYWPEQGKKKLLKKSFPLQNYDFHFEGPGPGCTQVFTSKSFKIFKDFIIENDKNISSIDYHDWLAYSFYRQNNLKWFISNEPKMLYRQHEHNQMGANTGLMAKIYRLKDIKNNWYKWQVINTYELITGKSHNNFFKEEKLILKPFALRRRKLHSLFIWLLIIFKLLQR